MAEFSLFELLVLIFGLIVTWFSILTNATSLTVSQVIITLPSEPYSKVDLGLDGVMRSLASNGTVLGGYGLTPSEITGALILVPILEQVVHDALTKHFKGVDGSLVPEDAIHFPEKPIGYVSDFVLSHGGVPSDIKARNKLENRLATRDADKCGDYKFADDPFSEGSCIVVATSKKV
ncbi:MAG: hypothetical protein Q9160_000365 [Pyrenula sp. 1 TL-2023]